MSSSPHSTMGGDDAALPPSAAERPDLVFGWKQTFSPRWRLAFFLLVAAAAHIAFFYLFRVVYPQPARSIPSPERITILSQSNPAARPILAQVSDRVSAYVGGAGNNLDLADHSTRFVPSFRNFDLGLRIPQESRKPMELPPLSKPGLPFFPPLAVAVPNSAAGSEGDPVAKVTLHGKLAGHAIVETPTWAPDELAALSERRFRFSAGFDSRGRPVFILPLDSPGNPDSPRCLAIISKPLDSLRIAPSGAPVSGTLEISW